MTTIATPARPAARAATRVNIKHIEPVAVSLPMTKPMKMAGVLIGSADNVLVKVELDGGHIGWGEAASAHSMTGETVESMMAAIHYMAPTLIGLATDDISQVSAKMDRLMYGNQSAKSAVEMALQDALGKAAGKPVYELLGGKRRARTPVLWLLGTGSTDGDVAEARKKLAAGFVAYKIKVGIGDPLDDAERTQRICDVLGKGHLISADANQGYTVDQAIAYVKAVANAPLDFFEQPVRGPDLAGMAKVAAATSIPIGFDEGLHGMNDLLRHHEARAARGASLKTIKLGGMRAVYRAAELCQSLGMKVNLACKVAESGIAAAAMLHLAAAVPAVDWGVSLTNQYLADDVIRTPLAIANGHADVPTGPGLGVEVDEARVREYERKI